MRVVEFIKENKQKARQAHIHLVDRIEPKWRHLSDSMNKKFNDALASPWRQQYLHFFDAELQKKEQWLADNTGLNKTYIQLKSLLGEETFIGDWFAVTQDIINSFAEVTGDKQWIHVEPEKAQQSSPYHSTIAHGFLTLSLIPSLTNSVRPEMDDHPQSKMVVNYGLNKVRFPYPVKQGKSIRARSRLIHIDVVKKDTLELVREIKVEIEGTRRPACVAESVIRLYF